MVEDFCRAVEFAARAHEGQTRKDGLTPYIVHPLAVSAKVLRVTANYELASAAVLHDVIEDCDVSADIIEDGWGKRISNLVDWVTQRKEEEHTAENWRERKERYLSQLRFAPCDALMIALCDKHDNLCELMNNVALDGRAAYKQLRVGRTSQIWYHEQLIPIFDEAMLPGGVYEDYLFQVERLKAS